MSRYLNAERNKCSDSISVEPLALGLRKLALDEATGFCVGCFRTIDEIRDWIIMLPDERQAVLRRLAERRGDAR